MKSLEKQGIGDLFGKISIDVKKAKDELKKEREKVDKLIVEEFKKSGIVKMDMNLQVDDPSKNIANIIESQKEKINEIKQEMDKKESDYKTREGGKERKIEDQKFLELAKEELEKLFEIVEKEEERIDASKGTINALKDASKEYEFHKSRLKQIVPLMAKQKDIAEALSGLYQSQSGNIDAIIERMSITGNIDMGKAFKAIDKGLLTLNAEITAQEKLLDILGMKNNVEAKAAADKASKENDISKVTKSMFKEIALIGVEGIDQIAILAKQEDAQKRINSLVADRTELLGKVGGAYSNILKLTQVNATRAGLLVQLADNYAIGVGASVKLRTQEFNAQGQIIEVLKERFKTEQEAYMIGIKTGESHEDNLVLRTKMRETQNEMLQAQIKQASIVKSMRDAWISAISAMSTGMDGFSEIIMNAEQNTAQIQQLDGAVRSSVSGAYALRDAFGRVIEDVGFTGSEVMNVFGDIHGRGGRRPGEMSYVTEADRRMGMTRESGGIRDIEMGQRGIISSMIEGQNAAVKYVASGGFEAHSMSNKFVKSVHSARDSFSESGIIDKNRSTNKPETSGYSMDYGFSSRKLQRPKIDEKWGKSLQEAPKDTLPRLIVNQKTDAIPVFVVNLKDVVGSKEKTSSIEEAAKRSVKEVGSKEIIKMSKKAFDDVKIGAKSLSPFVNRDQSINIAEMLELGNVSDEAKKILIYMKQSGLEVAKQADIQDHVSKAEKEYSDIKEGVIKREKHIIEQRKKELATLEKSTKRKEQKGVFQLTAKQNIGRLKNEIKEREQIVKSDALYGVLSMISKSVISSVSTPLKNFVSSAHMGDVGDIGDIGSIGKSLLSSALLPLGPLGATLGTIPSILQKSSVAPSGTKESIEGVLEKKSDGSAIIPSEISSGISPEASSIMAPPSVNNVNVIFKEMKVTVTVAELGELSSEFASRTTDAINSIAENYGQGAP